MEKQEPQSDKTLLALRVGSEIAEVFRRDTTLDGHSAREVLMGLVVYLVAVAVRSGVPKEALLGAVGAFHDVAWSAAEEMETLVTIMGALAKEGADEPKES